MPYFKVKGKLVNCQIMTKPTTFSLNISPKSKKFNNAETKATIRQTPILKPMIGNGNKKVINIFSSILKEYCFNIL